ncbi:YciI family protein [Nocardia brasiliensis]|uniref:YciI family protein n=1 Tax=Nocardia brasiliensis TaxID=37326 RepID=UPI002458A7A6|nr:YciI family protein [Nocardia brasiliensis]
MKKFLVLAIRTPRFDPAVIAPHKQFLKDLGAQLVESAKFGDGTGGAYFVHAENLDAAKALAFADPVHTTGSSDVTVYEWEPTTPA